MNAVIPFSYHLLVFTLDVYVLVWVIQNLGWQMIAPMLTMWGHLFHTAYFVWALLQDFRIGFRSGERAYGAVAEKLYTITFVLATIIGILFWGIYAVDRELVLPPDVEKYYPAYINMYQHGYVALLIWAELFVRPHRNLSLASDLAVSFGLALCYLTWNAYLGLVGEFPYPFQKLMPLWGHLLFDVAALGVLYLLVLFKRRCVHLFHPPTTRMPTDTASKARRVLLDDGSAAPASIPFSAPRKAKKIL